MVFDAGPRAWWVGWEHGREILARGSCTCRCFLQMLCQGASPSPSVRPAGCRALRRLPAAERPQDLLGLVRAGLWLVEVSRGWGLREKMLCDSLSSLGLCVPSSLRACSSVRGRAGPSQL